MRFDDLKLHPTILQAVTAQGYDVPTPIQREAIPHVLEGRDLVAVAQTGTGKTAAFALPILHSMYRPLHGPRPVRVLVLSPTRELASQIAESFDVYGKGLGLRQAVVFGGVGESKQIQALRAGLDILVATPGRLLDLMGARHVDFRHLEVLVLDEADRMLDMGFIRDVNRIISSLPKKRQTLLFSATMPADIEDLAQRILVNPVRVAVTPPATTVDSIAQSIFYVDQKQKRHLLLHLLKDPKVERAIVFSRTKHGANRIAEALEGHVGAAAIHGSKSQNARERALEQFRAGTIRALVATDIAARGIDVDGVTHVIQVDLPDVPEQYVHRIGRTARAGASGVAWSFCAPDERGLLRDIERAIRRTIDVVKDHPWPASSEGHPDARPARQQQGQRNNAPGSGRGGGGGRRGRPSGGSSAHASASHGSSASHAGDGSPSTSTGVRRFGPGRR